MYQARASLCLTAKVVLCSLIAPHKSLLREYDTTVAAGKYANVVLVGFKDEMRTVGTKQAAAGGVYPYRFGYPRGHSEIAFSWCNARQP